MHVGLGFGASSLNEFGTHGAFRWIHHHFLDHRKGPRLLEVITLIAWLMDVMQI